MALVSESLFPTRRPGGEGILPSQELRDLISTGIIRAAKEVTDEQIQPASIDLRLSDRAFRIRASFLPGRSTSLIQKATSSRMLVQTLDISSPTLLEPNVIYIIPLMESLALPGDVYGIANPKSTTGRLDIFTRLITEHEAEFERVKRGYNGKLYVEVVSQTFQIVVKAGMSLNQLRFARGKVAAAGDDALRKLQRNALLIADDEIGQATVDRGVRVTVDLHGNGSEVVAYQARKNCPPIELDNVNHYEVTDFWIPIPRSPRLEHVLQPGEFYILASKQKLRVPADRAAEMLPYDLSTQEFRVHYAGFFDPGFGYGVNGEIAGTKAVLEVRTSELPILLEDDQFVGRLNYFNMADIPDKIYGGRIGSSYQQQGLALAKQFRREEQFQSGHDTGQDLPSPGVAQQGNLAASDFRVDEEDDDQTTAAPTHEPAEEWVSAKNR